jgi:hypothetical protein
MCNFRKMGLKLNTSWENSTGNFDWVFHIIYLLLKTFSRDILVSVLINEQHDGVHGHQHQYYAATSLPTSVAFYENIMCWWKFYQGSFSFQKSLRNCAVESTVVNIHTVLPHHTQPQITSL